MGGKHQYKRKMLNLQVNRAMQLRMIGRISGILFVSLLFSSAIYFYFANEEITSSFQMFHIKARSFLDMLLPMVVGSFFISLIAGVVATLFFPKSYAGSLYRIEQDLQQVLQGDLTKRLTQRKGDAGTAVVGQLNQLIASFRDKFSMIQATLQQASAQGNPEAPGEPSERLREIHQLHLQLLDELQKLKMDSESR